MGSALTEGPGPGKYTHTSPKLSETSGRDELNETGHFARPKSSIDRQASRQSSFLNHRQAEIARMGRTRATGSNGAAFNSCRQSANVSKIRADAKAGGQQ